MKIFTMTIVTCLLLAVLPAASLMAQVPSVDLAQAPTGEIVFVSQRDGGFLSDGYRVNTGDIYVMAADGTNVRKLTDRSTDPTNEDWDNDNSPTWSPDGARIAFGNFNEPSNSGDIYMMFANAHGLTDISSAEVDEYEHTHPTWSPDGRKIIFEEGREGTLFLYTPQAGTFLGSGRAPDWSPDGARIAFHTEPEDADYNINDIFVMRSDGSNRINLTNNPADDREPAWSPDGTKLAFASNRGGNYDIYIMNADGSGLKRLMNNGADDQEPAWSPDGTQLAFTRIMPNGKGDIFVMNATGGNQINITNQPEADYQPDWKPASQMNVRPVLLISASTNGQVDGIRFKDEDILAYDLNTHRWQLYFDGSDVGLGTNDVNALGVLWNGDLLLSLNAPQAMQGLGQVDDADIVRFAPTTLGQQTAGAFDVYFTGSAWRFTTDGEDIDAIGFTADNALILSTLGNFQDEEWDLVGKDEDLLMRHQWYWVDRSISLYLDGSTVGLTQPSEDISDVWFDGDDLYLATAGPFAVPGVSGDGVDIFICHQNWTPEEGTTCTFRPFWDGSAHGFGGEVIDAFDIIYATELGVTAAGVDEPEADEVDDMVGDDIEEETSTADSLYHYFLPLINQQ